MMSKVHQKLEPGFHAGQIKERTAMRNFSALKLTNNRVDPLSAWLTTFFRQLLRKSSKNDTAYSQLHVVPLQDL